LGRGTIGIDVRDRNRAGTVLFIVGLALAALGQFYFAYRRQYVWDGVLFWAAAIVCLSLALRRAQRLRRGSTSRARRGLLRCLSLLRRHRMRALMSGGGLTLSITAGWLACQRPYDASYADLLVLWMIGVASFLLAFWPSDSTSRRLWRPATSWKELGSWLRENRVELVGLGILLLLALIVRAYDLEHIPANLGGDEGTQGEEALALVRQPLGNPFSTGWFSVPTMSFLVYGVAMRLCGATMSGLRTLSAAIGAMTVLTTFLLARELWGERVGWLSAAVLACSHYHIHFSRLGSNQIADPFFVTLSLWLLACGLRTKRTMLFVLTGAVVGLGGYLYFGARLIVVVVAGYLGWRASRSHRFLARHGRLLVMMLMAVVVVLAPLILHYGAHPSELVSRPRQVSIFASGWLAREREITGRSTFSLLAEQAWKSISAFNYTLDPTFWYRASIPLLDGISGLFLVLGVLWATAHYRSGEYRPGARRPSSSALLLIWFWLALLLGWVITENPPSSQRMVILIPALAIFVALGLDWLLSTARQLRSVPRVSSLGAVVALLMVIASLNLGYYFLVYTPSRVYGNPTAEMTTVLARYLAEHRDGRPVYLYGPPYVYWGFGTLRFMARGVTGVDVPPEGAEQPQPDVSRGARFVFHPARAVELASVRERYPGGSEEHVHSPADGRLLYALYEVSH